MDKEQFIPIGQLREIEAKLEAITREFQQRKLTDPKKIVLDHFEFLELFKISRRTSQSWRLKKGRIAYSRIGGRIYFLLEDVQRLVEDHRVKVGGG